MLVYRLEHQLANTPLKGAFTLQELSHRSDRLADSIIVAMSRLARECGAINLAQGYPDFDPPRPLLEKLSASALDGPHQYPVTYGAENFRKALARQQSPRMGIAIDPETQILVTCGSTEAIMCALLSICDAGDRVVTFSPFYETYAADAVLCNAEVSYVDLHAPDFTFDERELDAACSLPNTRAIILCDPANPCGRVFTREELLAIARVAERHDLYVITDNVYEYIVYAPNKHIAFASLPGMAARTISCGSLSKTYSITGWRIGYLIASPEVTARVRKVHDFVTIAAPAPLMEAATAALEFPASYYDDLAAMYTHKRDLFCDGLRSRGIPFAEPQGTYFVMCDFSELGYESDLDLARDLAMRVGVAGVPCSGFFAKPENRYLRMHFAKSDEVLEQALDRLTGWRKKMAS